MDDIRNDCVTDVGHSSKDAEVEGHSWKEIDNIGVQGLTCIPADAATSTPANVAYFDLGTHSRTISTTSDDAQIWFDRGLIWTYGFNHEEAASCFRHAISHDPEACMPYWGLAYALGPNYNKPWDFYSPAELEETLRLVHKAAKDAEQRAVSDSPVEQALVVALQSRYPDDVHKRNWQDWNLAFSEAMRGVYERFPEDLDVLAIYVDALMNLTPWKLWDIYTGKPAANAQTLEIGRLLDKGFSRAGAMQHPALLHLYIHFIEMSPTPEAGMKHADALRGLVPDAGHLQHMPSHIDVLCGNYQKAIDSNFDAIVADNKFFIQRSPMMFYTLYRCHDLHFRVYAAMLCGQSKPALESSATMETILTQEVLEIETPPMADWLESFLTLRIHVLVRFGLWNELLDLPIPRNAELYTVTIAMLHYGKALAHAAKNQIPEAEHEQQLFHTSLNLIQTQTPHRTLFNNSSISILHVASAMLSAEIAYRKQDFTLAFSMLQEAMHREANLEYDEPWGWMQPVRHAYGALLLEQDRVEEALDVYRADLGLDDSLPRALQHRGNVWALHGLCECLKRLGREEEVKEMEMRLEKAVEGADIVVRASCFCRLGVLEGQG